MPTTNDPNRVLGAPTKTFFAQTLTRDIELKDAILDLLDNCVDGLLRTVTKATLSKTKPYAGHWAHVTFNRDSFVIEDNCGGIDRELARTSAFRMGRLQLGVAEKHGKPTVGTYGIGMKRAIFKMGRSSIVTSRTKHDAFEVAIPSSWLADDEDWNLRMKPLHGSSTRTGTKIEVRDLHEAIKRDFMGLSGFGDELSALISQQFAMIMKKGFEVKINGKAVKPKPFRFISVDLSDYEEGVAPFLFNGVFDGVKVNISVGFYKPVPDPGEMEEEEEEEATFTSDESGWNVICNDRVVLMHDTSHLTGWGVGGLPNFHNQYIAIAGTAEFSSDNPSKLPLTTTKRGVDLNSELYRRILDKMQEGTKMFTSFTNRLKKAPAERKKIFHETSSIDLDQLDAHRKTAGLAWTVDRKLVGGRTFRPVLPKFAEDRQRVIRFSKFKEDISTVSRFLYGDESTSPGDVGSKCFDRVLEEAKNS